MFRLVHLAVTAITLYCGEKQQIEIYRFNGSFTDYLK